MERIQSYFHGDTFFSVHSAEVMCQTKIILFEVNCRLWLDGLGRKESLGSRLGDSRVRGDLESANLPK